MTPEQLAEHVSTLDDHFRRETPVTVYAAWIAIRAELRARRKPSQRMAAVVDGVQNFARVGHILDDAKRELDAGLAHIVDARDAEDDGDGE